MHYNSIFKTMYTFYQAFMTTKCSLVCSFKYYSLCLERWHAKVKKLHRNRVWLRTEQEKDTTGICCLIQVLLWRPGHQALKHISSHLLPSEPKQILGSRCLVQISALRWVWPGCFTSTTLYLIYKTGIMLPIHWEFLRTNQVLHVYRSLSSFWGQIKSSCLQVLSTCLQVSVSLTIPLFYAIATTPPS